MGAKESKPCITYELAVKRVNESELKRLREAFKRSSNNGLMSKLSFVRDVLGDFVPLSIAECVYAACGGTSKGITFKDLLCGLVLFTRGTFPEKSQFLFNIYSNETGSFICKGDLLRFLQATEPGYSTYDCVKSLFDADDKVDHVKFFDWLVCNQDSTTLSRWLLSEFNTESLSNEIEMPTFYQSLAGVTHLEEADIIDLEKMYWNLKSQSKSGRVDLNTIIPLISPPIPKSICGSLFDVFDENRDSHIDFKEMACGISAACRGPLTERQKFCFKVFDSDHDGVLSESEIVKMIDIILFIHHENSTEYQYIDGEVIFQDIKSYQSSLHLTLEEYVLWTIQNNISSEFLNLIVQVCHVVLGLKPISGTDEAEIVKGWLQREERRGLKEGQFWYLISMDWWTMWEAYVASCSNNMGNGLTKCSFSGKSYQSLNNASNSVPFLRSTNTSCIAGDSSYASLSNTSQRGSPITKPPPINNANLVQTSTCKASTLTGEGAKLKSNLVRGEDYMLVPDSLWKALQRWYGGGVPLPRQVIRASENGDLELELYPLHLRILRHQVPPVITPLSVGPSYGQSPWIGMVGGIRSSSLMGSSSFGDGSTDRTPRRYVAHVATFSRIATIKHLYGFLSTRLLLRPDDMRLWHFHEENNMVLIEDEDMTLEELGVCDDDQILLEVRNKDLTWPEEIASLSLNMENKSGTVMTEKGATGLNNLGNTCFMNAALQCVSNTRTLTQYFTSNMHLYELNRNNPLGMKGNIARRYGDLMHDIWSGNAKTIAPVKLRWTIGKYAPRFNGSQQHDSQELLAFLLDGLHEDLNRVQDKPYVELKDSECRPDVAVAQEAWENHIVRNKSIIVDLFHGQLKSKVTCNVCRHESVRFDPFNYLSLPLPMESYVYVQVAVMKLDGSVPVKYGLRLNADDKYSAVKSILSSKCDIASDNLLLAEINMSQIKTTVIDDMKVKGTGIGCMLYAYELPTSSSAVAGSDSTSGDEERLSICSIKSSHREAAQTFTAIQRSVRPGSKNKIELSHNQSQRRTISEDSTDSSTAYSASSGNGESAFCCAAENNDSPTGEASEILMDEISGRLATDSGHGSMSSTSLAESASNHPLPQKASSLRTQQHSYIIAMHRKMIPQDVYFVSSQKVRSSLFGLPVIVPCSDNTTHADLYQSVWKQVCRFVSALPPPDATILNHALDCDDSLGYEFPFTLKAVNKEGTQCAWCPWYRFCKGCLIQCCDNEFSFSSQHIAIDWDPTALHLRYLTSQENEYLVDGENCDARQSDPISLEQCLETFTTEEKLGNDEKYYCSKCKEHQTACKKLQIWRLPPILIIHLKRFQCLNDKWVKSQKVVKFPFRNLDIKNYLAAVPRETINRHRELKKGHNKRRDSEEMDVQECLSSEEEPQMSPQHIGSTQNGTVYKNALTLSPSAIATDNRRQRVESTSLSRTPIDDQALQDFHQHRLVEGADPFDIKYHLYAIVSHSGILGGGHYVSYACNPNGQWYCYNDSSCKEVEVSAIDTSGAYMLFYEREGISHQAYMPNVAGKQQVPEFTQMDQDFEYEYKKACRIA